MDIKTTLKVFNERDITGVPGVVPQGQIVKQLVGNAAHPTERLTVSLVTFQPGTHEKLHWHLIEVFYYVISGRASMTDIEGNEDRSRAGQRHLCRSGHRRIAFVDHQGKAAVDRHTRHRRCRKDDPVRCGSRHAGIDDAGRTAGQAAGAQPEKIAVSISSRMFCPSSVR